jgi:hypothetical protein
MDRESKILLGQGRCIRELLLVVFLYKTTERRERERERMCALPWTNQKIHTDKVYELF